MRDSTAEDNVRKRPFTTKIRPARPFGLFESVAKLQKVWESAKKDNEKFGGNGKNAYLYSVKKRIPLKG